MNNKELFSFFQEIDKMGNCFDKELALRAKDREYRKSDFFKKTRYSIQNAYKIYSFNAIGSIISFINSRPIQNLLKGDYAAIQVEIEHLIEGIDYTKLDGFFAYLEEKITFLLKDNDKLKLELDKIIKNFQGGLKK